MARRHSWRQNLQDLAELTESLISASTLPDLYAQLTQRIAKITNARACVITSYDRASRRFTTEQPYFGIKEKAGVTRQYDVTRESHRRWNFKSQGTLLSNSPTTDLRIEPYFVKNYNVKSIILAPMIVQHELLGLIAIMNKRGKFTEFDSYLASTIAYQSGIILTNAGLMDAEKRRVNQIAMLNETARQINSSLLLDDILEHALNAIVNTLKIEEVGIYMPNASGTKLMMKACHGPHHLSIKKEEYAQSPSLGLIGSAYSTVQTVYSNDCPSHPKFLPHQLIHTNSEACIPVQREGKVLAILNVESPEFNAFSSGDILILETVADQLALAYHNSMIYEGERKRKNQMLLLSELISELALLVDRQKIVERIAERIHEHFQYYFVAIGWVDEEEQTLKNFFFLPPFEPLKKVSAGIPLSQGLTGKCARIGKSVLVKDTSKSKEYLNVLPEVKSELVTPVRVGDQIVAVIDLQSDQLGAFDESDQLMMETLANAMTTALQNSDGYHRLERINTQLSETARMKDEIVQIVAHDFRSPLTVIRGYMDYLLKKGDWKDEKQREIMETVSMQAQRLQKLAEATLKASRLDSGDISFSYEKVDFNSFLPRLIFPWSEKHKFVVNASPQLPLVKADAGRLHEVLENLLSNAIKYSPDGGTIEVMVRKAAPEDLPVELQWDENVNTLLLVCISDEGIGIPPGKQELLFRRFTRLHDNRRIEGIGLGLYIAKKMIEKHGGRIWLEDKEKGSKFCFALPAFEEDLSAENILLIDDDVHTLRLLHKAISELGFDVITAADGREALDKLHRFKPQLIILDVLMPVMSGEELVERLRRNPETAKIPVIIFTGKSDFHLPKEYSDIPIISKNQGIQTLKSFIETNLKH